MLQWLQWYVPVVKCWDESPSRGCGQYRCCQGDLVHRLGDEGVRSETERSGVGAGLMSHDHACPVWEGAESVLIPACMSCESHVTVYTKDKRHL